MIAKSVDKENAISPITEEVENSEMVVVPVGVGGSP